MVLYILKIDNDFNAAIEAIVIFEGKSAENEEEKHPSGKVGEGLSAPKISTGKGLQ